MRRLLIFIISLVMIVAASCKTKQTGADSRLKIVTTVGMITDVVGTIAGEHANVTGLMGPGVDPHLYKASHGDVERLSKADMIFYNGLHLEGKMVDVLMKMARQRPVIAVTESIPKNELREPPEFEGHYDPHVWMVPRLWAHVPERVAAELTKLRPKYAQEFSHRADSLKLKILEMHSLAASELQTIPESQRLLVTAHDAFGYFGQAFGIDVRGLQGISTATDYGLADVTNLVDLLVERKIKAVFVETSVPTKPLEAVIEGCRSKGHNVKIGGSLFSDAMGESGTPEGTYVGMIRHNVKMIVGGLR